MPYWLRSMIRLALSCFLLAEVDARRAVICPLFIILPVIHHYWFKRCQRRLLQSFCSTAFNKQQWVTMQFIGGVAGGYYWLILMNMEAILLWKYSENVNKKSLQRPINNLPFLNADRYGIKLKGGFVSCIYILNFDSCAC